MSRPNSNAPSNMTPWVKAAEKDIDALQRKVADIERSVRGTGGITGAISGLADIVTVSQNVDGRITAALSNTSFIDPVTAEADVQINGTLSVGEKNRFVLTDVDGVMQSLPYERPSFSVTGADEVANPVTGDPEYTPGYLDMNDMVVTGTEVHGVVNTAGLVVNMKDLKNNSYVSEPVTNTSIIGNGETAEIRVIDIADNMERFIPGKYITILDAGVYSTPRTVILSVVVDNPNAELVLTFPTTFTDSVDSTLTTILVNPGYDLAPNSITIQGVEPEYKFAIHNQAGFHAGAGFAGDEPTQADATTHVYDYAVLTPTVTTESLTVGGGFGNTGLSVSNSGSISTDGFAYIGGGYGSTGVTLSTSGNISMNGDLVVDGGATFGGGVGSTGLTILDTGQLSMSASALSLTNGTGSIQIGADTGTNMALDNNDIQCRLSGAAADIFINRLGGDVYIGNSTRGIGVENNLIWANGVYGNALTTSYRSMYVSSTDTYDKLGYVASSRDEKKNIEPLSYTAEQILSVEPVQYHYNTEDDASPKHAGMIAEDLHDAGLHGYVSYDKEGKPATINYEFYVSALQQVVRHQADQIASLSARLDALEAR